MLYRYATSRYQSNTREAYSHFVAQRALCSAQKLFYTREEIIKYIEEPVREKIVLRSGAMTMNWQRSKRMQKAPGYLILSFLRNLGKGYEPKSAFDKEAIIQLAKLHADQDRLGGLLKLCLSENTGGSSPVKNVRPLLQEIECLQVFIAKLVMEQARCL